MQGAAQALPEGRERKEKINPKRGSPNTGRESDLLSKWHLGSSRRRNATMCGSAFLRFSASGRLRTATVACATAFAEYELFGCAELISQVEAGEACSPQSRPPLIRQANTLSECPWHLRPARLLTKLHFVDRYKSARSRPDAEG